MRVSFAVVLCLACSGAAAQAWPSKPRMEPLPDAPTMVEAGVPDFARYGRIIREAKVPLAD